MSIHTARALTRDTLVAGSLLLSLGWPSLSPLAQSFSTEPIEEVVVVGARLPRPAKDVVGKFDVITHETLVNELASSLSDLTRYTPGVSVATADTRFGETEFTIRGLSGNRVATLIDGVPVPDQFDIGSFANAGQDFLVTDAVSRVEILRGPASTLFGSDALGGVVAIVTRDPEEFLTRGNRHIGGSAGYSGRDDASILNGAFALGGDLGPGNLAGVLHLSRKEGHETDRAAVSEPDAQDRTQQSAFSKLGYTLPSGNRLRLDLSWFDESVDTDVVSVLGYGRQFRNTTSIEGDDTRTRYAATGGFDFESDLAWIDQGRLNLYWQDVEVTQRTIEQRLVLTPPIENERIFQYDTSTWGMSMDFDSTFTTAGVEHRIGWGGSLQRSDIAEQRDGLITNLATGSSSNVLLGEVMPVRDFPKSTVDELALYVHDEISLGRFTLIPGLRYQTYDLDADADAIYTADNPTTAAIDASDDSLSPKLGLLWHLNDDVRLYVQYAHGFRAPPFEDVNIGFDIPLFNYRALPNPDLKPETSDGIEFGLNLDRDDYRFSISVFGVDYDDLIETRANLGRDPATGTLLFQSRNIDSARVYGVEANFNTTLERWVSGLTLDLAGSWTRGDNRSTDEPLNTIDPPELIAALTWQPADRWRMGLITTAVAGQDRVDDTQADIFETDGFVLVDFTGSYRLSESVRIDAGLFNAFDKTYWRWSSVRNRTTEDPMIDYLSAPGRYASVSIRADL